MEIAAADSVEGTAASAIDTKRFTSNVDNEYLIAEGSFRTTLLRFFIPFPNQALPLLARPSQAGVVGFLVVLVIRLVASVPRWRG